MSHRFTPASSARCTAAPSSSNAADHTAEGAVVLRFGVSIVVESPRECISTTGTSASAIAAAMPSSHRRARR
jgi:hypothetical protein